MYRSCPIKGDQPNIRAGTVCGSLCAGRGTHVNRNMWPVARRNKQEEKQPGIFDARLSEYMQGWDRGQWKSAPLSE